MSKACSTCHGTGIVTIDCPYCRNTDDFEFAQLRPGTCIACKGHGYLEYLCPTCDGAGKKDPTANPLAKAGSF